MLMTAVDSVGGGVLPGQAAFVLVAGPSRSGPEQFYDI
jgi:hypothetical protein